MSGTEVRRKVPARQARASRVPASGLLRQAAADAGTLAVAAVVVAAAAFLATAVPRAMAEVATQEVRAAVSDAGDKADVVVTVPLQGSQGEGFELNLWTADDAAFVKEVLVDDMPIEISRALEPPVTVLVTPEMKAGVIGDQPGRMRFAYVTSDQGAEVEWVAGRAPVATGENRDLWALDGAFLPIEIALSEEAAALMDAEPGDQIEVINKDGVDLEVWLTGVFRPTDLSDPAWDAIPTLLTPQVTTGAVGQATVTAYLSAESLPFGRLAMFPESMTRSYVFAAEPESFEGADVNALATEVRGLASGKQAFTVVGRQPTVSTQLDRILDDAGSRVRAASAQAAVLLIGVLVAAALVELLAASVLIDRRSRVIAQWRSRGATLASIGLALAGESTLVAALAGAGGVALGAAAVPGDLQWEWIVPPLVMAALAAPCLGMIAAARPHAARVGSRAKAGFTAARVRRLALEVLLVTMAVAATVTLRARGVGSSESTVGADLVVLAAPVLVAVALAAAGLRVAGPLLRGLRKATSRLKGPIALLAATRMRAAALPLFALIVSGAIGAMAASASQTVHAGQEEASWLEVGADAAAHADAGRELPRAVDDMANGDIALGDIAGTGGLTVATATIIPSAQLLGARADETVRIVAIDAAAMALVLETSPLPDAPGLSDLATATAIGGASEPEAVPMLVTGGPEDLTDANVRWGDLSVPVARVGRAPWLPIPESTRLTVVVDKAALESALGMELTPTDAWVIGEGAIGALQQAVGESETVEVTGRMGWLDDRRQAPVARALGVLFAGAAAVAAALGALAVVLLAVSTAGERTRAVARLRVVGTTRRQAARIAWIEVAVPVAVMAACGTAVGVVIAVVLTPALGLASVTGQSAAPSTVIPWWILASPVALTALAPLAVRLAGMAGGRQRLGSLMRIG